MSYPIIAEFWSAFEGTLQVHAKRLVEDIAKHQHADPKSLWAKIKPQIKISLADVDVEPKECLHKVRTEGAVYQRCRAPCVIGFTTCPRHANTVDPPTTYEEVDRITDLQAQYFVDSNQIARDANGRPQGLVKDGVLFLFEKTPKPL